MAEKVKGELKVLKANDNGFYNAKIDGTWYSMGGKIKPAGVEVGDIVEGEYTLEKEKYKTITKAGLSKAAKAAAPAAGSGATTTQSSWAAKDDSIRYQSSRKDALTLLGLPGVLDSIVGKAKPADRQGLVEALVDKYTASYFEDVATFGAVARANGTTTADPAAPPREQDDE